VEPLLKERVGSFEKGAGRTRLIDSGNHVIDVVKPPR
jgi:hypothetical protein